MQRKWRLHRREDYQRLREHGRSIRHNWLSLSMLENGLPHNRYGFITGKQVGNAVHRNRVRRRLREIMRQLHPQLKPGYDIVVIARAGSADQSFERLGALLLELTRRAGLFEEMAL
jgi:ribonuclease P protein component